MANSPLDLFIFGCGYLGEAVAREALNRGWRVGALTRNQDVVAHLRKLKLDPIIQADLSSDDWHPLVPPARRVLNCVSSGGKGIDGYRHSYVDGMASIARWVSGPGAGIETFVYTSSTSVYPQGGGVTINEDASTTGAPATGQILLESEALLRDIIGPKIARWFILRLVGLYGPDRHFLLDLARAGKPWPGAPDNLLNLIHRDDAAAAIMATLDAPAETKNRVYNVADGHPIPRGKLGAWLASQIHMPAPHFDPDATAHRAGGSAPSRTINADRLRRELKWEPKYKTYREGFKKLVSR